MPDQSLLTSGGTPALLGLALFWPLALLWIAALLHCGATALADLRRGHAAGDQDEGPLTWLLLLFLGSFLTAPVYVALTIFKHRQHRPHAAT